MENDNEWTRPVGPDVIAQKVLTKAGFVPAGPAEPGGRPGTWYQRDLAAG